MPVRGEVQEIFCASLQLARDVLKVRDKNPDRFF